MKIVVVGSGIAGITFAEEVHKLQPEAEIVVLTHENRGYYSRPMLSHGFSRDDIENKIMLKSFENLRESGIRIIAPAQLLGIDRDSRSVTYRVDRDELTLNYDKLILAMGSDALVPPPFRDTSDLFHVINSLDDLLVLRQKRSALMEAGITPRWAVIGGGLIGCEVGSDLASAGDSVCLFHALPRLMERQLQADDSDLLLSVLQEQGVDVRLDATVQGFEQKGAELSVVLASGREDGFHGILVACGFKPRTEIARSAGLAVNRGILVDEFLRTEDQHIHAIGDGTECADGRLYAYIMPIRHQAMWLAQFLGGKTDAPWQAPAFKPRAKVHGFTASHPYQF